MAYHRELDSRFSIAKDGEKRYTRHIREMIRSRDARVVVAEALEAGELIGYLLSEIQSRPPLAMPGLYGFISDVYVTSAWRRRGVGYALYQEAKRWFQAANVSAIELYAADANPAAAAFWKSVGLVPFLQLYHQDI